MDDNDAFYRSQRALSSDEAMIPAHAIHEWHVPPVGLMTPPRTPTHSAMDIDEPPTLSLYPAPATPCPPRPAFSPSLSLPSPTATTFATAAIAAGSTPRTIPADGFPHIIDALFEYAPRDALATLRAVCRSWRDRADALLLDHVVLQDDYATALAEGGPVRTDWRHFRVQTLDVVDLDLASPQPLPPEVHTLRARNIARWGTSCGSAAALSALPLSRTFVLSGLVSDGACSASNRSWGPYLARTTRLVTHYNSRTSELGGWRALSAALALPSCRVREVVFIFSGVADELDTSVIGPLLMLSMHLGWLGGAPSRLKLTLVNALPWFGAAVDAGEALTGESEDVVALFLRAAGFGPGTDDEIKRAFAHYFSFVSLGEYRDAVGPEQFALEMGVPRRRGVRPLLKPVPAAPAATYTPGIARIQ